MRLLLSIITIIFLLYSSKAKTAPYPHAYFEVTINRGDNSTMTGYVICENFADEYTDEAFTKWLLHQSDYSLYDSLVVRNKQHFFEHPDGISAALPYCEVYQTIPSASIIMVQKKRMVPTCWQSVDNILSVREIDFLYTSPTAKERFVVEGPATAINHYIGDIQYDYWFLSYRKGQDLTVISNAIREELYESIVGCDAEEIVVIWDLIYRRYRKALLVDEVVFLKLGGL